MYWLPVNEFPMSFNQRQWLLVFLQRLTAKLAESKQGVENFLQAKHTRTVLNDVFVNKMMAYRPMLGITLAPEQQLPNVPTIKEIEELTKHPNASGEIKIEHLAPEYCAWFAGEQKQEQQYDFFGVGGMLMVWLDEGQEPQAPQFDIPRVVATHPAMKGVDFAAQMKRGMRLQHPFLKRSREVFAAHLPDGPAKRSMPFVLPRLRGQHFLQATPDTRAEWFELFSAYCAEIEEDHGVVLAFRDPGFDEPLVELIEAVVEEKGEYPL